MMCFFSILESPCGPLRCVVDERGAVARIDFVTGRDADALRRDGLDQGWQEDEERTAEVRRQLTEYFAGRRQEFDLPLAPKGTDFQKQVWQALTSIPFGATTSYGELAGRIGRPKASRAVGAANGANPIPIVVPCHRVIGANGSLTGFGGGLDVKRTLLEIEGSPAAQGPRQKVLDLGG
jgi:methylated-DNA-[protein]-cysteine S-methyltransferase